MPITIGSALKSTGRLTKVGIAGLLSWLWKHKFLLFFLIFSLPIIIASLQTAIQTKNPIHPIAEWGLGVISADNQLGELAQTMYDNPTELLGTKPTKGLWNKTKYYWDIAMFIYLVLGLIFFVLLPFIVGYKISKVKGKDGVESSIGGNMKWALWIGFGWLLFMNLIYLAIGGIEGTITASWSSDATFPMKTLYLVLKSFPLNGLLDFITTSFGYRIPFLNI